MRKCNNILELDVYARGDRSACVILSAHVREVDC